MTDSSQQTRKNDPELDAVLGAYLRSVEAGQPIERQELVARHPHLAADLQQFFASLDAVGQLTAPVGPAAEATQFQPREFGDYQLLEEIGRGGMGVVFKARQLRLDRLVAIKILPAGPLASSEARQRFLLEAQVAATLNHPNLVPVYEVGEHDGHPYFSMQYVSGGSLASLLASGLGREDPQQQRQAAQLVATVARAVQHAHERGVIHRDLKPGNILLTSEEGDEAGSGVPKVVDFGLAKWRERDTALTETNAVMGTASYMAPEQARPSAQQITTAVDVYGLGAILYEQLTGRPPFVGAMLDVLRQVQEREPLSPRQLNPRADRDLAQICLKCLSKDPQRRYASAAALADDLDRWLEGKPIHARPAGAAERVWLWIARHPWGASAALLAFVLLALAVVSGYTWQRRSTNAEATAQVARNVDRQFRLVGNLVKLTARKPRLRQVLEQPAPPAQVQRELLTFLQDARQDFNQWFTLEGRAPLVNLFVMGANGVLVADSSPEGRVVGHDFHERDYFAGAKQAGGDIYFSRVFKSRQDGLYKFAVVAPVRAGQRTLGYMAATIPVDTRLVTLDLADEPPGAMMLGPMDWHYSDSDVPAAQRFPFVAVLHPDYLQPGVTVVPATRSETAMLRRFEQQPQLRFAAAHLSEPGSFTDYARVGDTFFVVALVQTYPWPIRLFLSPVVWVIVVLLLLALVGLPRLLRRAPVVEAGPTHSASLDPTLKFPPPSGRVS